MTGALGTDMTDTIDTQQIFDEKMLNYMDSTGVSLAAAVVLIIEYLDWSYLRT